MDAKLPTRTEHKVTMRNKPRRRFSARVTTVGPPRAPKAMRKSLQDQNHSPSSHKENASRTVVGAFQEVCTGIGLAANQSFKKQSVKLVLADALTYVEKIKVGRKITRRPRELGIPAIVSVLEQTLPITSCDMKHTGLTLDMGWLYYEPFGPQVLQILARLCLYLQSLNKNEGRNTDASETTMTSKWNAFMMLQKPQDSVPPPSKPDVTLTLDKIKKWCDDWLAGKIGENDWDDMKGCLG